MSTKLNKSKWICVISLASLVLLAANNVVEAARDPAVISFGPTYISPEPFGHICLIGIVLNIGNEAFLSSPSQQGVYLYDGRHLVAHQPFRDLAPGQPVIINACTTRYHGTHVYTLMIGYDPDIYMDGNPANDDSSTSNNKRRLVLGGG